MYNQITANKRKTFFLILIFSTLILALGWIFGEQAGDPSVGIILAAIVATAMALTSYFFGDKVALATTGARAIKKEEAPELWRIVANLSIAGGVPMPKVYLIDDPAPNAFATGRKPELASVAVTTGLLRALEKSELEGVIAHELSHIKNYDILVMTIVIVLVGVVTLLADWLLRMNLFGRRERQGGQAALILFLIGLALSILSPLIAEVIKLAVSRTREYLADASGALLTRYPQGLVSALNKIHAYGRPMRRRNHATAHLFIESPFGPRGDFLSRIFSTHPPMEERIKRLRAMGI